MPADDERSISVSKDEIRDIVRQSVHDTLVSLGVENGEPIEMQKDFAHLRDLRKSSESIKNKATTTLIGTFVLGILGLLSIALKDYFK